MKQEILTILRQRDGFVSGQALCEKLGVSRTAVWKCINTLKKEGYEIESVTRKGYRLLQSPDLLTEESIRGYLSEEVWPGRIVCFSSVDSTNEEAKRRAVLGEKDGTLFVSDNQTSGKGRRGRVWFSPEGRDIFCTMLLRPKIPVENASVLTLVTALASAAVLEQYSGEHCRIKWPNDIILHDKKICGILTEMALEMDEISYVVVGVGFNINRKEFPREIEDMASSLYRETGKQTIRAAFLADFIREFQQRYRIFLQEQSFVPFMKEYEKRLINIGRDVRIIRRDQEFVRRAVGVNEKGELLVQNEAGKIECICSGEVSVRGLYGYV